LEIEGELLSGKGAIHGGFRPFWRQVTMIEGLKGKKETIKAASHRVECHRTSLFYQI
jgi:hypothetical protein